MKKINKLSILGLILAVLAVSTIVNITNSRSIAPPGGGGTTVTCYGYVKTSSGSAISGAKVVLRENEFGISTTVYTSSSGYYSARISVYAYSSFKLTISKSGYNTYTWSFSYPGTYRKDITLSAPSTHYFKCYGYIKDAETGAKLGGARVRLRSPTGSYDRTITTSSTGYYRFSMYTSEYKTYTLTVSKDYYKTVTRGVYSSGYKRVDINLHIPVIEMSAGAIDYTSPTIYYGSNIKVNMKLYHSYALADVHIRFSSGSGELVLSDAQGWQNVSGSFSIKLIDTDGSSQNIEPDDIGKILTFGNSHVYYQDSFFDFNGKTVEIKFKVKIWDSDFKLDFYTICRTSKNSNVFYQDEYMCDNAFCEPYDDETANMMSEILDYAYNDFIDSLYGPEIGDYFDMCCTITGWMWGSCIPKNNDPMRLRIHLP